MDDRDDVVQVLNDHDGLLAVGQSGPGPGSVTAPSEQPSTPSEESEVAVNSVNGPFDVLISEFVAVCTPTVEANGSLP